MKNLPQQTQVSENSTTPEESSVGKRNWRMWMVIGVVIAAVLLGGGYVAYQKQTKTSSVVCKDASDCPPANACTNGVCVPLTPIPTESSASAETANWKTYTSTSAGFSVKYPQEWNEVHVGDSATFADDVAIGPGVTSPASDVNGKMFIQVQKNHGPNGPASYQDAYSYLHSQSGNIDQIKIGGITGYRLKNLKNKVPANSVIIAFNYKDYLYSIIGEDTEIFNQILSTFKFTNDQNKDGEVKYGIKQIQAALELYFSDHKRYPQQLSEVSPDLKNMYRNPYDNSEYTYRSFTTNYELSGKLGDGSEYKVAAQK